MSDEHAKVEERWQDLAQQFLCDNEGEDAQEMLAHNLGVMLRDVAAQARREALEDGAQLAGTIRKIPCNCSIQGQPEQYCHKAIAHELRALVGEAEPKAAPPETGRRLMELVKNWREHSDVCMEQARDRRYLHRASEAGVYDECADELEALAAQPDPREAVYKQAFEDGVMSRKEWWEAMIATYFAIFKRQPPESMKACEMSHAIVAEKQGGAK